MNIVDAREIMINFDLKLSEREVFTYLADRSNDGNTCFPSYKTIAEDVRLSVITVKRAIKTLIEKGLIIRQHQFRKNGSQTSNLYTLADNNDDTEGFKATSKKIQTEIDKRRKHEIERNRRCKALRMFHRENSVKEVADEIIKSETDVEENKIDVTVTEVSEICIQEAITEKFGAKTQDNSAQNQAKAIKVDNKMDSMSIPAKPNRVSTGLVVQNIQTVKLSILSKKMKYQILNTKDLYALIYKLHKKQHNNTKVWRNNISRNTQRCNECNGRVSFCIPP